MKALSIIAATALVVSSMTGAGKSVPVVPTNGTSLAVLTGGHERTYYSLSGKQNLQVELDGPGKLVIQSRLMLNPGAKGAERYSLIILEKGKPVASPETQTELSKARTKKGNAPLGKTRKVVIKVPAGTHVYQVALGKTGAQGAALRFSFIGGKGRRKLVNLEALSYHKVVTAVVKEKLITYYVSSKDQRVQLRIIGPTRLQVAARLNFDSKMKGQQRYSIAVMEGEKRILLKPLATTKALGATYREWKEVTPGKVNTFYLDVPSGEHRYSFRLQEALANTVSLKFSVPEKDLSNEE